MKSYDTVVFPDLGGSRLRSARQYRRCDGGIGVGSGGAGMADGSTIEWTDATWNPVT